MKALNIPSSILKPGMVTYEDVYNSTGVLILKKNTMLDQWKIDRIYMNDIDRVRIRLIGNDSFTIEKDTEELKTIFNPAKVKDFKEKYVSEMSEVTNVIKEIGNGAVIDVASAAQISTRLVKEFSVANDVVNYLQLVRHLDDYTFSHSLNVALISIIIAKWLKLSEAEIEEISTTGLLHDIGKTKVSGKLLQKPGKLSAEEFEVVKKHTILGYKMMDNIKGATNNMKYTALMHHEKIDGSGYPTGALEDQIPFFAKIVAIADIYDAMTSRRSYRNKICPFEVIKDFEMQTFGKLDTKVLTVFLKNIANSYINDFVELNTGEICEIVFINPNRVWQPIVRYGTELIDLVSDSSKRFIKSIV